MMYKYTVYIYTVYIYICNVCVYIYIYTNITYKAALKELHSI